ncbi:hypothetical protein RE428_17090 [Marinobacter nanhaiticus D15-8W]|nr:alpha/beta fold hydrolase [Marinobacter nanhaiticus]BES70691.1 hypothetical protein RE428_17090 [Marinobacter nanhaiticus D15-8W]
MIAPWVEGLSDDIRYISLDDELLAQSRTADDAATRILERTEAPRLFIGWSLGGQIAASAAEQMPDKVRGLVTVCSTPSFIERPEWPVGMASPEFEYFRSGLERACLKQWKRFMLLQVRGSDQTGSSEKKLNHETDDRRALQRWLEAGPGVSERNLARSLDWLGQLDQRELWRRLDVPAIHLFAGRDRLVNPDTASILRTQNLDCRLLKAVPHWPHGEAADSIARLLTEFVDERAGV